MWRNGTGHKAERSTGPRKHADLGARTAAQHKQGKSIQQDGPKMTHRAMAVQERAAEQSISGSSSVAFARIMCV